jgi:hypothetical protein
MPQSRAANPSSAATPQTTGSSVVPHPAAHREPGPASKAVAFAKKHPVLTVAGGLAIGVAVSALLPRKAGRRIAGRAFDFAKATGAATLLAGHEVADKAERLGLGARKQASAATHKAEEFGEKAADRVSALGLAALAAASAFGRSTAEKAEHLGDAAADRSGRIVDLASELRKRIAR